MTATRYKIERGSYGRVAPRVDGNGQIRTTTPAGPPPKPWDVRFVARLWWWLRLPFHIAWAVTWDLDSTYPQARGFILAHVKGPVSRATRRKRLETCSECPFRQEARGRAYCGRCGCGMHPAARLTWKARLKAATCPVGAWPSIDREKSDG